MGDNLLRRRSRKIWRDTPGGIYSTFQIVVFFAFLILLAFAIVSPEAQAEHPDYVIADYSVWNGAVTGQVISYDKNTGDAVVTISNPKYFWTKIVSQNPSPSDFSISPDKDSLYANFGFLGPVSSTIPWEPGFSTATYKIHFDKEGSVNIGVDPTLNSGPEASFFNLAQIVLTAAPVPTKALSMNHLTALLDYINDTKELHDIADEIFLQGDLIGGVKGLVELVLFQPGILQILYTKVGLSFTIDQVEDALTLWKILDIVRQVYDQACTYIFENPSGYIIFNAITLHEDGTDDPYVIASFSANPQSASPNLTVQFDASRSVAHNDNITSYEWTFGDGTSDTTSTPYITHVYSAKGFYSAHLTVRTSGDRSDSSQLSISVGDVHLGGIIITGGTISADTTWTVAEGHHLVRGSFTIPEGATLTIEPGVKVELGSGVSITVNGTLNASGVTFTWAEHAKQWGGILFLGVGATNSRLENVTIEHALGAYAPLSSPWVGWGYRGIITIWQSSPVITGCTIHNSEAQTGILIAYGSPTVTSNTISGMTGSGVNVENNASPVITGNTISGNTAYGLFYSGTTILDATNNDWGDPSGPLDDSDDRATGGLYNPNGKGDRVSDHVNYYPWQGLSLTGTVVINPEPDAMNATAPWILTDPNSHSQSGMGDQTLSNSPIGDYMIIWGDVSGWAKPSPASSTQALTSGGTITFSATYVQQTIPIIQVTQSILNFGYVPPGSYKDLILVVKNIGGGILTGTVSACPPFSIVSGGNYSLGAGESQQVFVRYTAPLQEETQTCSFVFSGGGGITIQVKGTNQNVGLPWLLLLLGN